MTEKGQGGGDKQPVWWNGMFALCARKNWLDILQCVTKWMTKNTVPVTKWKSSYGKGEGDKKICIWGLPVTISEEEQYWW